MIDFDRLVDRLDRVRHYDGYVAALCPFHADSNPSLLVYRKGFWRCLAGCGTGSLDQLWNHLSGRVSTKPSRIPTDFGLIHLPPDLAEAEELANSSHDRLRDSESSLGWYLKSRKLDDRIYPQRLGWFRGWYLIPVYHRGRNAVGQREFVGLVARADAAIQEATGSRYTISAGTEKHLYVPDWQLVERSEYLCVTFGIFDALALTHLRIPSCSPTTGKNLNPRLLDWWRGKIIVIPDHGEESDGLELVARLGWRGRMLKLNYDESGLKDPADYLERGKEVDLLNGIRRKT